MYLNEVTIIGNITRDLELRALPSGMNVASFSVATNRVYKDRDGKKVEQTDFHNVVVFGRQADTCAQYLKKGSQVLVKGRLQTRSWEGKDGEKKYRTEIVADRVQFGNKPRGASGDNRSEADKRFDDHRSDDEKEGVPSDGGAAIDYPKDEINPDDIPF